MNILSAKIYEQIKIQKLHDVNRPDLEDFKPLV